MDDLTDVLHYELYSEIYEVTFNPTIMYWGDGTYSRDLMIGMYIMHRASFLISEVV